MKNIQILILALFTVLTACHKDEQLQPTPDPTPDPVKRLVNITNKTLPNDWTNLKYDNQGRVIQAESAEDRYSITYSGNEVHVVDYRITENRTVFDFTGKLNAKGNIVSGAGASSYVQPYAEKYTFEYDAAGNMTKKIMDRNNGQIVYTYLYSYKDGNLAGYDVYVNGVYDYGGKYEYTDKEDKMGLNWNQFETANTFTGNVNKNLMSKYTGYRDGKESWHVTFTYEFDADGFPVTVNSNYSSGKSYSFSYKYQ